MVTLLSTFLRRGGCIRQHRPPDALLHIKHRLVLDTFLRLVNAMEMIERAIPDTKARERRLATAQREHPGRPLGDEHHRHSNLVRDHLYLLLVDPEHCGSAHLPRQRPEPDGVVIRDQKGFAVDTVGLVYGPAVISFVCDK